MATQETITSTLAALSGSTFAILATLVAVAAIWLGADHVLNALDIDLPVRQLMLGRNLNALTLYARWLYTVLLAGVRSPA